MDCRGRCYSYRIGLRPSTRNEGVCLLCLGIGKQEFQAAHLIATKAKTCQVVAFNPQLRPLDHCRQTRCLIEGCGQECQRNSRNVLQAKFKASIQAHKSSACGDPCLSSGGGSRRSLVGAGVGWLSLPFDPVSLTNQERNATQVKVRQHLTSPPCVRRLLVR